MAASKKTDPKETLIHGIEPYVVKKGEEYMNPKQHEHFRNILTAWRQELLDEVSRTVHSMQDETENHPDPNDRASQETDISLELRSRDRERKLIKKIDESLEFIETSESNPWKRDLRPPCVLTARHWMKYAKNNAHDGQTEAHSV
jgi:DnaK suppressor protein